MREIKFRAYHTKLQEMVKPEDWHHFVGSALIKGELSQDGDNIFMQFTGLQDRKGKDIYEGDIIKGRHKKTRKEYYRTVQSRGDMFVLLPNHSIMHDYCMVGEVIGNIYENPELLEGQ